MRPSPKARWRCSARNMATRCAWSAWASMPRASVPGTLIPSSSAAARMSRRTGDIGLLKIVSESAVASGVRRIEALTGEAARSYLAAQDERVREAAELLKVTPDEMIGRLAAIIDERRKLERQLADAKRELALGGGGGGGAATDNLIRELNGVKLLARIVQRRRAEGFARADRRRQEAIGLRHRRHRRRQRGRQSRPGRRRHRRSHRQLRCRRAGAGRRRGAWAARAEAAGPT